MAADRLAACAASVADEMGLDRSDVQEIVERVERFRKSRRASATLDADVRAYAKEQGEQARIAAALKRKQAALNILIRDEIDQRLAKVGGSKARALEAMLVGDARGQHAERQSVNARRVALEAAYGESLAGEIQKDLPHLFDLLRRPADAKPLLDDVAREWRNGMDGRTGNQDARALAKVLAKYAEAGRLDANRAGANIGKLDDWGGPQSYDERRLIKAGQDAFVRDMLAELDLERSFGAGTTPDEAAGILADSWDTITLGRGLAVTGLEKGERLGPANLARSMEAHRVWHFKDADAWIRINDRYGRGSVLTATIDHLHRMARKVSLMQVLGPNPEVMLNSVLEEQRGKVKTGSKSKSELDELSANLATGSGRIGRAFREVMGDSFIPENLKWAQIWAGVRGIETMAKLGGSALSSVTDLATYAHALRIQGHGLFTGYAKALAGLFNGRSKAETQQLQQLLGTGFDAWLGAVHGRFAADDALPGRIANAQRIFFKLNGQQWWDRNLRTSFMAMTAAEMRQHAHLGFDALPDDYRHFLGLHGIDAARWEAIRATEPEAGMLVPERIADLPDEAIHGIVADRLNALDAELGERIKRRQAQDERSSAWVTKRVAKYQAKLAAARERLSDRADRLRERQVERRTAVEARLTELDERLSELAELASNTNISERKVGRVEGRLGEKIKQAENIIRAIVDEQELKQSGLSEDFESLWRDRHDALLGRAEGAISAEKVVRGKTPNQRLAEFREAFDKARQRLSERMDKVEQDARQRGEAIGARIDGYADQLTSLDEAVSALRFSRRQIGRDEGRITARIKQAQRELAKRDAAVDKAVAALGGEFETLWRARQDELTAFITKMDEQARARAEAGERDVAYQPERLSRVYEKARRDLELQLRGLLHDESGFGIITPDDRTRANILQGTAPGSLKGEAFRFFMQFKSFSFAYMQKALSSNRGRGGRDWGAMAALIGMSTVLGYGAMTMKDALKNKTPKDPTDIKTIIAAMLQGGGLGIYGDFLFSKSDRFGSDPVSDFLGPTASTISSVAKAVQNWTSPDKTLDKKMQAGVSDLFWTGLNNTPYLNLFYTRAALDFAILNWLQERMTPGTFRRRASNMAKDYNQRYILPPLALTGP